MATIKISKILSGNIYRDIKERKIIWDEFDNLLKEILIAVLSYSEIRIDITIEGAKPGRS